jgi:glycolate oxidase iron-sulfur subunit
VHCGFCTATCPTYQLLGDELDGPRGRIYLMKEVLEGREVTAKTQLHLDRCLTCRSCETTCPSGVKYGRLVDIGRNIVEQRVGRSAVEALKRKALRTLLPNPSLFNPLLGLGQLTRPLLPEKIRRKVPPRAHAGTWPAPRHARRMLVLQGCVQPGIAPDINPAVARVLDRIGISLVAAPQAGCCGAVSYHLNAQEEGLAYMRRNVDAWWPEVEQGVEAIVMTASGCGVMVKDYGRLLQHDPGYAKRAMKISSLTRDTVEVIGAEWTRIAPTIAMDIGPQKVAFHSPCSLQHGLQLGGRVEEILQALGLELLPVADSHLCCGSAGTYSLLQPELSGKLKAAKLKALEAGRPDLIATANIGCLAHLADGAKRPVRHWIELLDARMLGGERAPSSHV